MSKRLAVLVLAAFCLQGCCTNPPPPQRESITPTSESISEEIEPPAKPADQKSLEPSYVRTFGEKWEDFRRRLKYREDIDLIFYAEELFDEVPRKDHRRKLELAFFLLETHQKKGNLQKAKEYSQHYKKLLQAAMGGTEYQSYSRQKAGTERAAPKWEEESAEESE